MELTVLTKNCIIFLTLPLRCKNWRMAFSSRRARSAVTAYAILRTFTATASIAMTVGAVTLVTDDSHRTIGMTPTRHGRILGCASNLHAIVDVESGETLVNAFHGVRLNGTNDVIEDSRGRIWFSDPYVREFEGRKLGRSFVFCLEDGELSPVCRDLPWPNGLALSPDEQTLYLIDSRELRLYALNLATRARRVLVQFTKGMGPGLPDGMRVRADGTIFVAGPGGISVIAPEGNLLGLFACRKSPQTCVLTVPGLFITASTGVYHLDLK